MRTTNALLTAAPPTFVAIDFETADYGRDSACALALVRVEASVISHIKHCKCYGSHHAQSQAQPPTEYFGNRNSPGLK